MSLDPQTLQSIAGEMAAIEREMRVYFPEALDPLKAALAVDASNCLKSQRHCQSLVFDGGPSSGKTLPLDLMMPRDSKHPLTTHIYRSDKFTAASFVSHRADVAPQQVQNIDLLPKLKDKTLITKELAPLFHGRVDQLREVFAILTTVLDGMGYTSDTGSRGSRGYTGDYIFQWLGATTPPSHEALELLATLGPRILFYHVERPLKDVDALVAIAEDTTANQAAMDVCRHATEDFLTTLHASFPVRSVEPGDIGFPKSLLRQLVLWALVVVALRAAVEVELVTENRQLTNDFTTKGEHPERVLHVLKTFALGSALVHGRLEVNDDDLAQVRHIATSSGVPGRQRTFLAVLINGGLATTPEVQRLTGVSTPTALRYMSQLAAVGLATFTNGTNASPAKVDLVDPYLELVGTRP